MIIKKDVSSNTCVITENNNDKESVCPFALSIKIYSEK